MAGPSEPLRPADADAVRRVLAAHRGRPGPLLEVLHGVQAALGCVPGGAVALIAEGLNLTRAEVHGVVTFYHFFRREPAGRHVLELCRAESCQAVGAERLADHARARLGVDFNGTTADGRCTLLPVYCLGHCACGPAAMIDGRPVGRLTPERLDAVLDAALASPESAKP